MDIKENITRKKEEKKEEVKEKKIFSLTMEVIEQPETEDAENFIFKGKVKADKMDSDLMSTIFAKLFTECVPEVAREEVLNQLADKLGFYNAEEECDCEESDSKPTIKCATISKSSKDKLLSLLKNIFEE